MISDVDQKCIALLNSNKFGGFSDWRLPAIEELKTLIDSKNIKPAINTDFFPNTQAALYWSSTKYIMSKSAWWLVNFISGEEDYGGYDTGSNHASEMNKSGYVRAVRGGQ